MTTKLNMKAMCQQN